MRSASAVFLAAVLVAAVGGTAIQRGVAQADGKAQPPSPPPAGRAADAVLSPQEQTRREFARFFEMQKKAGQAPDRPVGAQRKAAAVEVKNAPDADAKRKRLLRYQEQRVARPDARNFVADNPLLEEVSAGEDREFAQLIFWNEVALRVTSNDHTAPPPGGSLNTHPFEQVGPARTSRAMAIVHIAMFEAVNAVHRRFESYKGIQPRVFARTMLPADIAPAAVSVRHAIAHAAYRALHDLYPGKEEDLDTVLVANLAAIQAPDAQAVAGTAIGDAAAHLILEDRALDGSELPDPPASTYRATTAASDPLKWRQDPLNASPAVALGANWRYVRPFVLTSAEQFRPKGPPARGTPAYNEAFAMVLDKGGDKDAVVAVDRRPTMTSRSETETFVGKFWAYDGTALLCAPPRLYNMIATSLALSELRVKFPDAITLARYLALVNVAMADAGIAAWEAKYYYLYARPVTAIRAATPATAPITAAQPFWTPLGAPVTNGTAGAVNFSPPFPAYPSGHAVFGGALFQTFRNVFGDSNGPEFTFVSDEYNGFNSDPGSPTPRPRMPQKFPGFAKPERDNADSRIYLGIHWKFDADDGIDQGNKVADYVFAHSFKLIMP